VQPVHRFGPFIALPTAIAIADPTNSGYDGDLVGRWAAVAALLGWIALIFAGGSALLVRRDVE
jgi:hypothetical protein